MSILGRVGEHPNFWGDIWESKFGQVSGQLNARFWPSRPLSRQLLIAVKAVFSCMHSSVNEIYLLEDKLSHTFFYASEHEENHIYILHCTCTATSFKAILPQAPRPPALRWCRPLWEREPLQAWQPVSLGSRKELWWDSYGMKIWEALRAFYRIFIEVYYCQLVVFDMLSPGYQKSGY